MIRRFMAENFYVAEQGLADDASLIGAGVVDSTGVLEVVTFLESTFGFVVEDAEMLPENLDSIARIAAFVERKRSAAR
jgi:acyl carrier protein